MEWWDGIGLCTLADFSTRDDELTALVTEVTELKRLESIHSSMLSSRKLLLALEQRAKESHGIARRTIEAHTCRIKLSELMATAVGEKRVTSLVQLSDTLLKLCEEDTSQSVAPKSFSLRILLAVACKETAKEGIFNSRVNTVPRLVALMKETHALMQMPPFMFQFNWVDPLDECVVPSGAKHAIQAEKMEGDSLEERVQHCWGEMTQVCMFAIAAADHRMSSRGRAGHAEQVGGLAGGLF